MRETYIFDTSVFIDDPNCLKKFSGADLIIPIEVLEELDKLKLQNTETGKNARISIKNIEELSKNGSINEGVKFEKNCKIIVNANERKGRLGLSDYGDDGILACGIEVKGKKKTHLPIILSEDLNLRIRARSLGLEAKEYQKTGSALVDEIYPGFRGIESLEFGEGLRKGPIEAVGELGNLLPNEGVYFYKDKEVFSIGRRIGKNIVPIKSWNPWGISSRSREQSLAMDLLMDRNIPLVTLLGRSGTGKSLLALAAALEGCIERKKYSKIIIYRPIQPVGNKELGYMPGTMQEKLQVWFTAILDAFEFLFSGRNGKWETTLNMFMEKGLIEFGALSYIRGRSINNAYIVIDEAQNISQHEAKTLLTRVGEGTKVVMTGDLDQLDTPNLFALNSGMYQVISKFKDSHLAGHITLRKGERSVLATEASKLL